jgi:predicted transcriptional regulator of viral defense system
MKTTNTMLGPLKMKFFSWSQSKKKNSVRTGDLVKAMRLSPKQEADLFYNLSSSGLILKLWRGYYLVPEKLPPGGRWSPSPYLVINKYMDAFQAKYEISGPTVFNSYGFTNQISSMFVIYNDKVSKKLNLLQYQFEFRKVKLDRLGPTKKFQPYGDSAEEKAALSIQEKALLDAVYDYKKFGTLPKAYGWIKSSIENEKITALKLSQIAKKHGNTMSQKRIGWLLENLGVEESIYKSILTKIPKNQFLVPLDPRNNKGPINKKWGVIENVSLPA